MLTNLSVIIPTTSGNVVNDVSLVSQYNHLKFDISTLAVEISAPQSHYRENGCFAITILLGGETQSTGSCVLVLLLRRLPAPPLV